MDLKKKIYQRHTFYTIKNKSGLEITFCNYGASIYSIRYKGKYATYHEKDYDAFLHSNKFSGKTLGRVSGRIQDGKLKIKGKTYQLEKSEKNNTLHGGIHNISFRDFETNVSENKDSINVIFKYISPDGECGFPHEVNFTVTYSIAKKENKFSIKYQALSSKLTPVSMAPHIYWRLGDKNVLNHFLMINANEVTKLDQQLIIKGKERVKKIYDFRHAKKIGQDIIAVAKDNPRANGYDCGYVLNKTNKPQVVLKNQNIKLSIKTDMNMAIVYTNCYNSKSIMNGYGKDVVYGGIAIEPQTFTSRLEDKFIDGAHPFDHYILFHLEEC